MTREEMHQIVDTMTPQQAKIFTVYLERLLANSQRCQRLLDALDPQDHEGADRVQRAWRQEVEEIQSWAWRRFELPGTPIV